LNQVSDVRNNVLGENGDIGRGYHSYKHELSKKEPVKRK